MLKQTCVALAGILLAASIHAGDLTVDNLAVHEDAVFHGNIIFQQYSGTNIATTNGIVGWWRLDDGTGTNAADSSSTGNHAELVGSPVWTDGLVGMALEFDGITDGLNLNNIQGIPAGNSEHTISAWIKINALPADNAAWIMLLGNPATGAHNWLLAGSGAVSMGTWGSPYSWGMLTTNQWKHLAATFDGTTLHAYVDGMHIGSTSATFNLQGMPFQVASRPSGHTNDFNFHGIVDDVRIYDRALTSNEVVKLFATSLAPYQSGNINVYSITTSNEIYQAGADATNVFMGAVGFGTTAPEERLHIMGNVKIDGTNIVTAITLGGVTRTNWTDSGDFKSDGSVPMSGPLNMAGQTINDLGNVTNWSRMSTGATFLRRDGTRPMTGDLNMDNNKINNCAAITLGGERRTNWPAGGTEVVVNELRFQPIWATNWHFINSPFTNISMTPKAFSIAHLTSSNANLTAVSAEILLGTPTPSKFFCICGDPSTIYTRLAVISQVANQNILKSGVFPVTNNTLWYYGTATNTSLFRATINGYWYNTYSYYCDDKFRIKYDNGDVVLDTQTGLMWARNANIAGTVNWSNAMSWAEGLSHGGYNDWRLPTLSELLTIVNTNYSNPALPTGHPFNDVIGYPPPAVSVYWTSTSISETEVYAVGMALGGSFASGKSATDYYAWPVRSP